MRLPASTAVSGLLLLFGLALCPAQAPPRVSLTAEQDHQRVLDQLKIDSLRPGADGDPNSPRAANYDETKAGANLNLPDPLKLNDGQPVTTPQQWWQQRRPEIIEFFDAEVFGRVPAHTPGVTWEVGVTTRENVADVPVITKQLLGHVDNSAYPTLDVDIAMALTIPANAKGRVPVMVVMALTPDVLAAILKRFPEFAKPEPGPTWQQQILSLGWGYAIYYPTTVQADDGAGLTSGIIGLLNHGQPRKLDDWGALRAWAWGASRCLDYFETDPAVDAHRVGIQGHSRFGKASLIAMAYDPRFAIGYISSSGAAGAALFRRNFGEQIGNIAGAGEYHWMAGNFLKYAGPLTPQDLPVDMHELVALSAPRPLFIGAGATQGDGWVDARGMFLAEVAASPVYQLLGKPGLGTSEFPPVNTGILGGQLAFRQHSQGHTPAPNWPAFLEFAQRHFAALPATASR